MRDLKKTLLSIGECMVELSPSNDSDSGRKLNMNFAGDSFNMAWYARQLLPASWKVSYLSAVGNDDISADMISFIDQAGIDTDNVARLDGLTVGLYMIRTNAGERSFAYWRNSSAARKFASDPTRLAAAMEPAGTIFFSGISIAILSSGDRQNLYDALTLARGNGSIIVFDSNLRPALWQSMDNMREEVSRFSKCANIVLPSFDDEALHFGDTNPQVTLARYLSHGAELVVVKNGPGVIIAGGPNMATVQFEPPIIANPVDTTAAGDSFNAGFLSAYFNGENLMSAIENGSCLSAKVIGKRGALVDV